LVRELSEHAVLLASFSSQIKQEDHWKYNYLNLCQQETAKLPKEEKQKNSD